MTAKKTASAPARPSLARKVTPKDEKARQAALNEGVRITIDGQVYEVRVGDLTVPITRELRKNYGGSFNKLMTDLATDPDLDLVSTWIWLARRVQGEDVDYQSVEITYSQFMADGFDLSLSSEAPEVEDSPEA